VSVSIYVCMQYLYIYVNAHTHTHTQTKAEKALTERLALKRQVCVYICMYTHTCVCVYVPGTHGMPAGIKTPCCKEETYCP